MPADAGAASGKVAANIIHDHIQAASGEELYCRFLDGDADAFEQIVRMYEPELSLFINGMIHDTHETKHLVIEAFAGVAAGQFKGESSLKTYLFTIAKNQALRLLKHRRHHLSLEDVLQQVTDAAEAPVDFLVREENRQMLRAAMQRLKPQHMEVLRLLYFADMSYREAGRVMGKSPRQIEGLAYRAKAALKKILESEGYSDV